MIASPYMRKFMPSIALSPACSRLFILLVLLIAQAAFAASAKKSQPVLKTSSGVVKIGVITDISSAYKDISGNGSVLAARMAIEDFGGKVLGVPVELVSADHQLSPATAKGTARDWMENDKVDMIVDVPNSTAAVEVIKLAKALNRVAIISSAGSTVITNEECTPNSIHWSYNTMAVTSATVKAIIQKGGKSWYFVTSDYLFGHSLESDAMSVVKANGGTVLGAARHPFPSNSYSSLKVQAAGILQAQASKADVIGFASTGTDAINAIKQASQFGIAQKQRLAALSLFITDVHAVGLYEAQDLFLTTGFYWDLNDDTRKWSKRFFERHNKMPTMAQAGVYSAVTHYLKAIQAAGTDEAKRVVAKMKEMPVNDFFAKNGKVRVDGRMVHDMYLMQVKKPSESKYPWDYYHVREVIPGEKAFTPLSESKCPLVKAKTK